MTIRSIKSNWVAPKRGTTMPTTTRSGQSLSLHLSIYKDNSFPQPSKYILDIDFTKVRGHQVPAFIGNINCCDNINRSPEAAVHQSSFLPKLCTSLTHILICFLLNITLHTCFNHIKRVGRDGRESSTN